MALTSGDSGCADRRCLAGSLRCVARSADSGFTAEAHSRSDAGSSACCCTRPVRVESGRHRCCTIQSSANRGARRAAQRIERGCIAARGRAGSPAALADYRRGRTDLRSIQCLECRPRRADPLAGLGKVGRHGIAGRAGRGGRRIAATGTGGARTRQEGRQHARALARTGRNRRPGTAAAVVAFRCSVRRRLCAGRCAFRRVGPAARGEGGKSQGNPRRDRGIYYRCRTGRPDPGGE